MTPVIDIWGPYEGPLPDPEERMATEPELIPLTIELVSPDGEVVSTSRAAGIVVGGVVLAGDIATDPLRHGAFVDHVAISGVLDGKPFRMMRKLRSDEMTTEGTNQVEARERVRASRELWEHWKARGARWDDPTWDAPEVPDGYDWRGLLKRYLDHIGHCEGVYCLRWPKVPSRVLGDMDLEILNMLVREIDAEYETAPDSEVPEP